jgi:hypothetical protein
LDSFCRFAGRDPLPPTPRRFAPFMLLPLWRQQWILWRAAHRRDRRPAADASAGGGNISKDRSGKSQ